MKHQIYSLIEDKTEADRELVGFLIILIKWILYIQMMLKDKGTIRLFKLGNTADEFAVCFTSDYVSCIKRSVKSDNPVVKTFISTILSNCKDVSVSKTALSVEARLSEPDIS